MGSIKDRISNAIKKSQNDRYNRDALDEFGDMNFKIAESNIKDAQIEKHKFEATEEDLDRLGPKYSINANMPLKPITGEFKLKLNGQELRPIQPKVLTDDERYAPSYMIVDKKDKKLTGWSMTNYMYEGAPGFEEQKSLGIFIITKTFHF